MTKVSQRRLAKGIILTTLDHGNKTVVEILSSKGKKYAHRKKRERAIA